jgi:hypothetical protein
LFVLIEFNTCIAEHLRASAAWPTALAPPIAVILRESGVSSTQRPINFIACIEIAYHANANAAWMYTTAVIASKAKQSRLCSLAETGLLCFARNDDGIDV